MRAGIVAVLIGCLLPGAAWDVAAQTKPKPKAQATKSTSKPAAPKPAAAPKVEAAKVDCPALLGDGVTTQRAFCDVLTGRDPAEGIRITIPPHTGPAVLTFELHNRHTYSEQQVKAGRAFAEYMATIGVLLPDGSLVTRAAIKSSFRTSADLVDRITGGAGPGGVKAVAPVGTESIRVEVPSAVTEVSLLGEKLVVERLDGRDTFTSPGRPIAIVSNIQMEYKPAPATKPAPAKKTPAKKPAPKKR